MSAATVAAARDWLERYLSEDLSAAEREAVEREDLLFRMVAIVERHERAWLLAALSSPTGARGPREDVVRSLTGPLRHHLRLAQKGSS